MILNEVYFGKEYISHIQRQLTVIRKKLHNKKITSTTNLDTDILKFNRLIEDFFGFNNYALYLTPDYRVNTYTFPVTSFLSNEEKVKVINSLKSLSSGFKYNKEMQKVSLIMAINYGLFSDDRYTDEEIMATVLHELGRGFFEAVTDKNCEYTVARYLTNALSYVNKIIKDKIKFNKKVNEEIVERDLIPIERVASNVKHMFSKMDINKNNHFMKESMGNNMRSGMMSYTNEKFADTFAASYGYAEELHSALMKMTQLTVNDYLDGTPVHQYSHLQETIKSYGLYVRNLFEYICGNQNEHPEGLTRMKVTLDYLKKEVAKEGIDPMMKKELLGQIDEINKLIDDYINYPKDKDHMRIYRLYTIKLYKKFGGDRRERDADNDALFDTIDSRYDSTISKKESFVDEEDDIEYLNEKKVDDDDFKELMKKWRTNSGTHGLQRHVYNASITDEEYNHFVGVFKILKNEKDYNVYKKAFDELCNYCHVNPNGLIITKYKLVKLPGKKFIHLEWTANTNPIKLPENVSLYHTSPVSGIKALNCNFRLRGRTSAGYLCDKPRIYLMLRKKLPSVYTDNDLIKKLTPSADTTFKNTKKLHTYEVINNPAKVFVDPMIDSKNARCMYVETNKPLPVRQIN